MYRDKDQTTRLNGARVEQEKTIDPFRIKKRLLDFMARYDDYVARTPLTPIDLNPRARAPVQSNKAVSARSPI